MQHYASILLLALFTLASAQTKVNVTVYYEALCPDSQKFITNQLVPVFKTPLASYMNIILVPYGRVTKSENGTLMCHHGPVECYGNEVQACALEKVPSMDHKMNFINCLMKEGLKKKPSSEAEYPAKMCADETSVNYDDIKMCVEGTQGNMLISKMGNMTDSLRPKLGSVPTVTFNMGASDPEAIKNLKTELCKEISGEKPHECQSGNNASQSLLPSLVMLLGALLLSRIH